MILRFHDSYDTVKISSNTEQPYNIMDSPPCLTVGNYKVPFAVDKRIVGMHCLKALFLFYLSIEYIQKDCDLSRYSLAKFIHSFLCLFFSNEVFFGFCP